MLLRAAQLPSVLLASLREYLAQVTAPLAVRSSSMFEDSRRESLSGIYGRRTCARVLHVTEV